MSVTLEQDGAVSPLQLSLVRPRGLSYSFWRRLEAMRASA